VFFVQMANASRPSSLLSTCESRLTMAAAVCSPRVQGAARPTEVFVGLPS
jgi:hypothetical protein